VGRRVLGPGLVGAALAALLLLPRAGAGQAQPAVDIRCVGFEQGGDRKALLHLHNADDGAASAQVRWRSPDGTVGETTDLIIPVGTTVDDLRRGDAIGITAQITADRERLVVDGEMVYDDQREELHRRTVTCLRVR
jgi:hypothetical protein